MGEREVQIIHISGEPHRPVLTVDAAVKRGFYSAGDTMSWRYAILRRRGSFSDWPSTLKAIRAARCRGGGPGGGVVRVVFAASSHQEERAMKASEGTSAFQPLICLRSRKPAWPKAKLTQV